MFTFIRKHGTFANIVSILALTFALGGTSYAAAKLPKNSVGSKQIKAAAVQAADLHADAVTSAAVLNGSLTGGDLANGSVTGDDLANGSVTGDDLANGSVASQDLASGVVKPVPLATTKFEAAAADLANGANGNYDVYCNAGQQAIGGGGRGDDTLSEETILTNTRPAISSGNTEPPLAGQGFTGWRITVVNPAGGAASGIRPEVWVVCMPAS
jgi:hypothetical protein